MGVVLKEALLNEGFEHYNDVFKTMLLLCVDKNNGPEYYINIVQENIKGNDESITLASNIRDIYEAHKVFEEFTKAIALEGFGLSHMKGQNSLEEKDITGENVGLSPEELEKQKKEELVRDLVQELDETID